MKKLLTLLVLVLIGFYFYNRPLEHADQVEEVKKEVSVQKEFGELTIPFLRSRSYQSKLGEQKLHQQNSNYQSYLTSYDSDGFKVNGLLTIPSGKMPEGGWPAIVFVHGYIAPSVYRTTEKYGDYVDYLARNGFVVFKIDLRGHGQSEGEADGAYYSSDYVIDTLNARAALQNSEIVDPESIGLWGHSMAGNVTFRAFVAAQDIPALVTWAGVGYTYDDLARFGLNDNSYRPPSTTSERENRRARLRELYGDFSQESEFWSDVTPINYLSEVQGEVQVHHAVDDSVVNIGYGRDLMKALDNSMITHTMYEYQTGGHNLSGSTFTVAMKRTVDFYKANLGN